MSLSVNLRIGVGIDFSSPGFQSETSVWCQGRERPSAEKTGSPMETIQTSKKIVHINSLTRRFSTGFLNFHWPLRLPSASVVWLRQMPCTIEKLELFGAFDSGTGSVGYVHSVACKLEKLR
jgi:hypothetical protein